MSNTGAAYIMGHTDHERRRLSLQATVLNPLTESFLRRAGLSAGMRVLDFGCGVGEVSRIASRLVGPHGSVTGIDLDPSALEICRARAREGNYDNSEFLQVDLAAYEPDRSFDAVIGRHILIHLPDPLAALTKAVKLLHPGGLLAFQEYDLTLYIPAWPEVPSVRQACTLIVDLFRKAIPYANVGMRLFQLMQQAGLHAPQVRGEVCIDGGEDSPYFEWLAETVRSLLPKMEQAGLVAPGEIDPDTLAQRMRDEVLAEQGCIAVSPMIGAFARKH